MCLVGTHRPSEGEVKLQSDGLGEGECVLAEGLTRYVAEAAWADGCDVGLVLLEAEPEGGGAGCRARRMLRAAAPAAPAAASPVHQRAPVVRQREDLHLEEPATGCRLQSIVSLVSCTQCIIINYWTIARIKYIYVSIAYLLFIDYIIILFNMTFKKCLRIMFYKLNLHKNRIEF